MWRHKELPPVQRLLDGQNALIYEMGLAQMQQAGGQSVQVPAPPERLLAPGEQAERPKNVVSIREFAQRNRKHVRREVS